MTPMELYPLKVFLTVATERSFSRAGEKLLRTQPAISIAIQRLEGDLKEKLIDRSGRELILTDAGRVVLEYARRFQGLESDLETRCANFGTITQAGSVLGLTNRLRCI